MIKRIDIFFCLIFWLIICSYIWFHLTLSFMYILWWTLYVLACRQVSKTLRKSQWKRWLKAWSKEWSVHLEIFASSWGMIHLEGIHFFRRYHLSVSIRWSSSSFSSTHTNNLGDKLAFSSECSYLHTHCFTYKKYIYRY